MNEINYTQGMWLDMDTYYNQYRLYGMYGSRTCQEITMLGRTLFDRADEVIIIHRPDKLSPRKEVMKHTME
jgi:hypothetical protein